MNCLINISYVCIFHTYIYKISINKGIFNILDILYYYIICITSVSNFIISLMLFTFICIKKYHIITCVILYK